MDFLEKHPWRQLILKSIEMDISINISDDDQDWVYLDGEMIKIGSLEHSLLDLPKIQNIALDLLSTKSKDLRILGHLIRTLQHSGNILDLLLGLRIFTDYVGKFWIDAAPTSVIKKNRLGIQVLKRFDSASTSFSNNASRLEKDEASKIFDELCDMWTSLQVSSSLLDETHLIKQRYLFTKESGNEEQECDKSSTAYATVKNTNEESNIQPVLEKKVVIEPVDIDSSNDRAWKNTLLKVADYLTEKDEKSPIGYELRRYALWSTIVSAPISENSRTPLAAPLVDRVLEYEKAIEVVNIEIWKELEYSLTLSPYWFDGHYISAKMAEQLNYQNVANIIKKSVSDFLERLPILKELTFNDGSPFVSKRVIEWIEKAVSPKILGKDSLSMSTDIVKLFNKKGLNAALDALNSRGESELRQHVYDQVLIGELLSKLSLHTLAREYYSSIYRSIEHLSVREWEPSLFSLLEDNINKP